MAADMRAETGPGASGCARGSQTWSGTAPAFEPNPTTASTNAVERTQGARCGPWAAITAKDWLPARSASSTNAKEQHRRPELGHHRVPLARPLHLVARTVVGEDQQQRRHRHQLPQEQEGADGGRGRHEQQGRDEEGQHARPGAAGESVARIAEAKDHGAQPDAGGDGDEKRAEPIETKREAEQREQLVGVHRGGVAGGEHVGGEREPAHAGGHGEGDRQAHPGPGRRHAPTTAAARPSRAVATKRSVLTSPTGSATRR